jgi:hypothetical protein
VASFFRAPASAAIALLNSENIPLSIFSLSILHQSPSAFPNTIPTPSCHIEVFYELSSSATSLALLTCNKLIDYHSKQTVLSLISNI